MIQFQAAAKYDGGEDGLHRGQVRVGERPRRYFVSTTTCACGANRTVVKVNRLFPSSQLCSTCGHRDRPKPLAVRSWTCPACGVEHDRDLNSARNVLAEGRRIAAGPAEIANACGAGVRPGLVPAVGCEAGTRLARLA